MKRLLISCLWIIVVFTSAGAACANGAADNLPYQADTASPIISGPQYDTVVNVDDLMVNPEDYTGQLCVSGVVSFVSHDQRTLGLIDSREFAECGVTTCSSFILPVQWDGPMPLVEDSVEVTGEVQKSGGKFVFIARSLERSGQ